MRHLAVLVGRGETTVHNWLRLYTEGGLEKLLEEKPRPGRPKKLTVEEVAKLQQELQDPEGFNSYGEIYLWSQIIAEMSVSYSAIYQVARQELKAKLKVARPVSYKREELAEENFRKTLVSSIVRMKEQGLQQGKAFKKISFWCQDETRLGLRSITSRRITLQGIKPQGKIQFEFEYYYIYGLVELQTGRNFWCEFSHLNTDCFQVYLNEFSHVYSQEYHIIQLDNARFHKAKKLIIPENIILFFQPPYCPQVNPIERVWQHLKSFLKWKIFPNLEQLRHQVAEILKSLTDKIIYSLTGWDYFLQALSLSGL